jgi:ribosome-binding factor A
MHGFTRNRRIADQIQKDLSDLIRLELKDPRVKMVTITEVDVSGDNSHAKVYVSSLLGRDSLLQSLEALHEGAYLLRQKLGRRLHLRTIPQLHFVEDLSLDRAQEISSLIDQAIASDATHPKDS